MKILMKSFYVLIMLGIVNKSLGQGIDIIIAIDNSGSISNGESWRSIDPITGLPENEFADMTTSINAIIENVLECNDANRVAVVHYGSKIHIESDFTNNLASAQNFTRRFFGSDVFYNATGFIGNALDNLPNPNIVSPQSQLNRNPQNDLVVFLFTDALRDAGVSSSIVNPSNSTPGSNAAFQVYTDFKNNRNAKFVVVHFPPNPAAREAGAAIASAGGSYDTTIPVNTLEIYPSDPDTGAIFRSYYPITNFNLSQQIINEVSQDLCDSSEPEPPCNPISNIRIENGFIRWDGNAGDYEIEITPDGFCDDRPINQQPFTINTMLNEVDIVNEIQAFINIPSDNDDVFSFRIRSIGCIQWSPRICIEGVADYGDDGIITQGPCDNYQQLLVHNQLFNNLNNIYFEFLNIESSSIIDGNSNIRYVAGETITLKSGFNVTAGSRFIARIEACIPTNFPLSDSFKYSNDGNDANDFPNGEPQAKTGSRDNITVYPNPNNGLFTVVLENITEGTLQIKSFKGDVLYENTFKDQKEFEIDIRNKPNGIYLVCIKSNGNEQVLKIVKE